MPEDPKLVDELQKMEYEPLNSAEKVLILTSLGAGPGAAGRFRDPDQALAGIALVMTGCARVRRQEHDLCAAACVPRLLSRAGTTLGGRTLVAL